MFPWRGVCVTKIICYLYMIGSGWNFGMILDCFEKCYVDKVNVVPVEPSDKSLDHFSGW